MPDEIDYTKYSLAELQDARRTIDDVRYANRAAQIDLLIRDRIARESARPAESSVAHDPMAGQRSASRRSTPRIVAGVVVTALLVTALGVWILFRVIGNSSFAKDADEAFGDQHIKTVVALVELHKVRYGEYPKALKDIRFAGQWDLIHIKAVSYCPNEDLTAYYIEVRRGWIGKPDLKLSAEYWQGTGYDPEVGPCT